MRKDRYCRTPRCRWRILPGDKVEPFLTTVGGFLTKEAALHSIATRGEREAYRRFVEAVQAYVRGLDKAK